MAISAFSATSKDEFINKIDGKESGAPATVKHDNVEGAEFWRLTASPDSTSAQPYRHQPSPTSDLQDTYSFNNFFNFPDDDESSPEDVKGHHACSASEGREITSDSTLTPIKSTQLPSKFLSRGPQPPRPVIFCQPFSPSSTSGYNARGIVASHLAAELTGSGRPEAFWSVDSITSADEPLMTKARISSAVLSLFPQLSSCTTQYEHGLTSSYWPPQPPRPLWEPNNENADPLSDRTTQNRWPLTLPSSGQIQYQRIGILNFAIPNQAVSLTEEDKTTRTKKRITPASQGKATRRGKSCPYPNLSHIPSKVNTSSTYTLIESASQILIPPTSSSSITTPQIVPLITKNPADHHGKASSCSSRECSPSTSVFQSSESSSSAHSPEPLNVLEQPPVFLLEPATMLPIICRFDSPCTTSSKPVVLNGLKKYREHLSKIHDVSGSSGANGRCRICNKNYDNIMRHVLTRHADDVKLQCRQCRSILTPYAHSVTRHLNETASHIKGAVAREDIVYADEVRKPRKCKS